MLRIKLPVNTWEKTLTRIRQLTHSLAKTNAQVIEAGHSGGRQGLLPSHRWHFLLRVINFNHPAFSYAWLECMKGAYLILDIWSHSSGSMCTRVDQWATAVNCSIRLPLTDDVPAEATQANRPPNTATNLRLITSHLAPDSKHFPSLTKS